MRHSSGATNQWTYFRNGETNATVDSFHRDAIRLHHPVCKARILKQGLEEVFGLMATLFFRSVRTRDRLTTGRCPHSSLTAYRSSEPLHLLLAQQGLRSQQHCSTHFESVQGSASADERPMSRHFRPQYNSVFLKYVPDDLCLKWNIR